MPSIRVEQESVRRHEALERLEASRRHAGRMGVDSARRYRAAKSAQGALVAQELWEAYSGSLLVAAGNIDRRVELAEAARGEGMRQAAARNSELVRTAQDEMQAWTAEQELERRRHALSVSREHLENERRVAARTALPRAQRTYVDQVAAAERQAAIRRHQLWLQRGGWPPLADGTGPPPGCPGSRRDLIVLHDPMHECQQPASDLAVSRSEYLEASKSLNASKVASHQQSTAQRAAEVLAARRREEAKRAQHEADQRRVKELMSQAALKVRPALHCDVQEEESRKTQAANRRAHLDFERIFLQSSNLPGPALANRLPPQGAVDADLAEEHPDGVNVIAVEELLFGDPNPTEESTPTADYFAFFTERGQRLPLAQLTTAPVS